MYQYSETETEEPEHTDREDQEIRQVLYTTETIGTDGVTVEATKAQRVVAICSCGRLRCYAVDTFGLPAPTYWAEIEPLPGQSIKDRRAVQIRERVVTRVPRVGDVVRCKRCTRCVEVTRVEQITLVACDDGEITESVIAAVSGRPAHRDIVADSAVAWCLACGADADLARDRRAADAGLN